MTNLLQILLNILNVVRILLEFGCVALIIVRLVECINQLSQTPEAQTVWQKIKQILKNFFLDIEQYKKASKKK